MGFQVGGDANAEDEVLAEINVTPLVDVMLVLLIIFMIATPMLHQGVEVALPQIASENLPLRTEDPMVITVTKDELVYIKNEPVHPSQLVERLQPLMEGRRDESVFIKGDRDAPYGAVLRVIDIVNAAGTYRIGLVTEPLPAGG
ncbi:MAG TPA: ExbD/TolR family protein [Thermoanaerobaculia bacterium]|nr:ExbD/TolR family protein [Thermoanaerobaculia bacterium]